MDPRAPNHEDDKRPSLYPDGIVGVVFLGVWMVIAPREPSYSRFSPRPLESGPPSFRQRREPIRQPVYLTPIIFSRPRRWVAASYPHIGQPAMGRVAVWRE